jgi:DNA-binding response OmpR family regulator
MKSGAKILLAEDDPNLGFVITDQLTEMGFQISLATDGVAGWTKFQIEAFDLCIIDVMMPGLDGFSLAKKIREKNAFVPIIFLTAKSLEQDRLKGFEIGGDDYITKPFSMMELHYRIKVFFKRGVSIREKAEIRTIGQFEFDVRNLQLSREKQVINLTQREADLLQMLHSKENDLVKREDILVAIWGENDYFKGRSMDVFISRLRKYLEADPKLEIRNHHGVGFMLINHGD